MGGGGGSRNKGGKGDAIGGPGRTECKRVDNELCTSACDSQTLLIVCQITNQNQVPWYHAWCHLSETSEQLTC